MTTDDCPPAVALLYKALRTAASADALPEVAALAGALEEPAALVGALEEPAALAGALEEPAALAGALEEPAALVGALAVLDVALFAFFELELHADASPAVSNTAQAMAVALR